MKYLLSTTAVVLALASPASASILDWNFQDHLGLLGNTQTFTAGGLNLLARGFTPGDVGTALFGKNGGGDENGLGLNNDLSGDHEITGLNFVQLNLDGIKGLLDPNSIQFQMGSTTQNEGWQVFGSNDDHPFQFTLLASSTDPGGQEGLHSLAGGFDNYSFFYSGLGVGQCGSGCNANVLLANFDATLAATPLPGTLGFMAAGLGLIGWARRKIRRSGAAKPDRLQLA